MKFEEKKFNIGELKGISTKTIEEQVIKIFEACSFQDITGQRITKVVATLKTIEGKVETLVNALGNKMPGFYEDADGEDDEVSLLNGPQLPDQAISQDDIDKLLAEFDK